MIAIVISPISRWPLGVIVVPMLIVPLQGTAIGLGMDAYHIFEITPDGSTSPSL